MKFLSKINKGTYAGLFICFFFFIAYLTLSLIRHSHFLSGYDLAIVSQYTWEYSNFKNAISTISTYAFTPAFYDHIEFIYIFLSPFYWFFHDARILLVLQSLFVAVSGIPVFLLMKKYKINLLLSLALLISYFSFYGIQNAIWADVHSLVFAASFLAFFIYFLDKGYRWGTLLFFFLAITSKEDIAILTFLIAFSHFVFTRKKMDLVLMLVSLVYFYAAFFLWFPSLPLANRDIVKNGFLSNMNLLNFVNTGDKRQVILYSLSWYGFLPLLSPVFLLPFLGDLSHYFIFGEVAERAQSIFMHYRVTLSILLIWPTILAISKFRFLNKKILALYILFFAVWLTYLLHAPLTYLTKKWFWTEPAAVKNINNILRYLPVSAPVVSQNNITPHISERYSIFTLWPEKKTFVINSPCGKHTCDWFRWAGKPEYLIVDTSSDWDIRHFLANRPDFVAGLKNMETAGVIKKYKEEGNSVLYKIGKNPN